MKLEKKLADYMEKLGNVSMKIEKDGPNLIEVDFIIIFDLI